MNKLNTEILSLGWIDDSTVSKKRWFVLALFCIYGGVFGLHRFYAGKIRSGFMMLVTLGPWRTLCPFCLGSFVICPGNIFVCNALLI